MQDDTQEIRVRYAAMFRRKAEWRDEQYKIYRDHRNTEAANAARSLADYLETRAPDECVLILKPGLYLTEPDPLLGGAHTADLLRTYGFGYATTDSTHEDLVLELGCALAQDAYEYCLAHPADRAAGGGLWAYEVQAARMGVSLSALYFRQRFAMVEGRLRERADMARVSQATYDQLGDVSYEDAERYHVETMRRASQ
jgi:hypothetical protein